MVRYVHNGLILGGKSGGMYRVGCYGKVPQIKDCLRLACVGCVPDACQLSMILPMSMIEDRCHV